MTSSPRPTPPAPARGSRSGRRRSVLTDPEDLRDLVRRYRAGERSVVLAKRFETSPKTVLARLRECGQPPLPRPPRGGGLPHLRIAKSYRKGFSIAALASRWRTDPGTIKACLRRAGEPIRPVPRTDINEREIWRIAERHLAGESVSSLARERGLDRALVLRQMDMLGVPRPPPGGAPPALAPAPRERAPAAPPSPFPPDMDMAALAPELARCRRAVRRLKDALERAPQAQGALELREGLAPTRTGEPCAPPEATASLDAMRTRQRQGNRHPRTFAALSAFAASVPAADAAQRRIEAVRRAREGWSDSPATALVRAHAALETLEPGALRSVHAPAGAPHAPPPEEVEGLVRRWSEARFRDPLVGAAAGLGEILRIRPFAEGTRETAQAVVSSALPAGTLALGPALAGRRERLEALLGRLAAKPREREWTRWTLFALERIREAADGSARIARALEDLLESEAREGLRRICRAETLAALAERPAWALSDLLARTGRLPTGRCTVRSLLEDGLAVDLHWHPPTDWKGRLRVVASTLVLRLAGQEAP